MSPLDLSGKGHVDRAVAVRVFSRVRPPGMKISLFSYTVWFPNLQYFLALLRNMQ